MTELTRHKFASRVRDARIACGLTQGEAARKADIQPAEWGFYEQGSRTPTIFNLAAICRAVDVSADHLLFGKDGER